MQFPNNQFIPLDEYVGTCNAHYYAAGEAIGADGDFITAPEISQMFGEVLGAWVISRWDQMGRPTPFQLIELGPGKGTLMADMLRVLRQHPDANAAAHVHLVETSPNLRAAQKQTLRGFTPPIMWHDDFNHIPAAPFILIANEFLDALPIKQLIYTLEGWLERGVIFKDGKAGWATAPLPRGWQPDIPPHMARPVPGNILEASPAIINEADKIIARLKNQKGSALIIDYGYAVPDYGDTFQALRHHAYADPLEHPGEQDLTAHVNFNALENLAHNAGVSYNGPAAQGDFLISIGLKLRVEKLLETTTAPEEKLEIIEAAHRLTHPSEMGTLFKVLCLSSPTLPAPEGFHAS